MVCLAQCFLLRFCHCLYTGHALFLSAIVPLFPTFNTWVLQIFLFYSALMLTLTTLWGYSHFIDQHTKVQRAVIYESEDLHSWLMCHFLAVSPWESHATFLKHSSFSTRMVMVIPAQCVSGGKWEDWLYLWNCWTNITVIIRWPLSSLPTVIYFVPIISGKLLVITTSFLNKAISPIAMNISGYAT